MLVSHDELKRAYVKDHNLSLIEISYKDKTYEKIKEKTEDIDKSTKICTVTS